MNQYIITKEELNRAYGLRHEIYSDIMRELFDGVRSHPYNPQQCDICKNGFCSLKGNKNIQNIPCSMVNNFVKGEQK